MNRSSIFLCAPTSSSKDYILSEYSSIINKMVQRYKYTVHICDNSPVFDIEKYKRSFSKEVKIHHLKPKGKSIEYIYHSQKLLREEFLKTDCQYFAFIESDLLPNINILEYLKAYDLDVIGMPYFIGKEMHTCAMVQVMEEVTSTKKQVRTLTPIEVIKYADGKIKKAYSIGFGTVLIKRHVIESIPFRITENNSVINGIEHAHADSFFYADCYLNNIEVYLCTDYFINHYNQNWTRLSNLSNLKLKK